MPDLRAGIKTDDRLYNGGKRRFMAVDAGQFTAAVRFYPDGGTGDFIVFLPVFPRFHQLDHRFCRGGTGFFQRRFPYPPMKFIFPIP